jgi:uncharacterized protein (TIGR03382 family)
VAEDEAGNQSRSSVTVRTPGYGGGCSAAGGSSGLPVALALGFLGLLGIRRRRGHVRN